MVKNPLHRPDTDQLLLYADFNDHQGNGRQQIGFPCLAGDLVNIVGAGFQHVGQGAVKSAAVRVHRFQP